jgi:hypothetical protein
MRFSSTGGVLGVIGHGRSHRTNSRPNGIRRATLCNMADVTKERRRRWSANDRARLTMYERAWAARMQTVQEIRDERHDERSKIIQGRKRRRSG